MYLKLQNVETTNFPQGDRPADGEARFSLLRYAGEIDISESRLTVEILVDKSLIFSVERGTIGLIDELILQMTDRGEFKVDRINQSERFYQLGMSISRDSQLTVQMIDASYNLGDAKRVLDIYHLSWVMGQDGRATLRAVRPEKIWQ